MSNGDKIILHLFADMGTDSKPYEDAGYSVLCVGELIGVENYEPPGNVYGIIANIPCTNFAGSGAQYWGVKDKDGRTLNATKLISHCLKIIALCKPRFWVIENPVGRMKQWLGNPVMYYQPWEYGDQYTKKTCLWGVFNKPKKNIVVPVSNSNQGNKISCPVINGKKIGWHTREAKKLRSICPPGFAQAFYEANQ